MIHSVSTTNIHIPVSVVDQMPQTSHQTLFTTAYLVLFQCVAYMAEKRSGLVAHLSHLWTEYYPRVAFGEQGVIMPPCALTFITGVFLAFIEIKSQGQPGFPFQTHPQLTMFSVTSLVMYGLASAAELVVSVTGLDTTSVYALVTRLGRICFLCILVVSLASLFYF